MIITKTAYRVKKEITLNSTRSFCFLQTIGKAFGMLFGMLLFLTATLQAQGRVMGQVLSPEGNPVSGATVFLSGQNATQATLTNAQGYYVFLTVPEGAYEIRAARRGMPAWKSGFTVIPAQTHRLDIKLGDTPDASAVASAERKREERPAPAQSASSPSPATREKARDDRAASPAPTVTAAPVPVASAPPATAKQDLELQRAVEQAQQEADALTQLESGSAVIDTEVDIEGGIQAVYKKIKYPPSAERAGIQGQVIVRVYVSPNGQASRVTLLKSDSKLLSDEVFRVITEETTFKPAKSGGKPVLGILTLPITFRLK